MSDEWTVKEIIEAESGKVYRLYWYKGKLCKRVKLDSPMARQLAGYVLIEKDLRSAGVWLKEIADIRGEDEKKFSSGSFKSPDRERYNLVKGLFVAALTFYGKAFAQCEGRRIKLDRAQLPSEFHGIHDVAISFRNNFAAHSGAKLLERAEVALVFPQNLKKVPLPRIYREMTQPDYAYQGEGEKTFDQLVECAQLIALQKIAQLEDKIMKEDVLPKGYDYWKAK